MIINRLVYSQIELKLKPNKVALLLGARRVGKTFLLNEFTKNLTEKYIFWNGEDIEVQSLLSRRSVQNYKNILGSSKLLIIDEAQKIPDIGMTLKLMVDSIEGIKILVTGSSVFDLGGKAGEPLVGRKSDINIYPISEQELASFENILSRKDNLKERLVYGNMPEIISLTDREEKKDYLRELVNSYLLRDILTFEGIKNSGKILDLLKLIAYQIGSEVSLNELSRNLGISKNTVERYLDLLSKVFIVYRLGGFSRNLRKEVVNHGKWFFYDNGVKNAIINSFNPIEQRNDIGQLWENYMVSERIKYQSYKPVYANNYFWRTYDQQEIDWVEERDGNLFGHEFKWKDQKVRVPKAWEKAYPEAKFEVIHQDNYFDWVSN
jgi:predicted AAA+ superfamily ATPase